MGRIDRHGRQSGRGIFAVRKVHHVLVLAVLFFALTAAAAWAKGDVLTVANQYDAKSLDPIATTDMASGGVMRAIYDNLLEIKPDLTLEPRLAESWRQLNDLEYEFVLRKGVAFQNGEPFTADDVKFTFERAMGPAGNMVRSLVEDMESVTAVDDHKVVVKLKKPNATFLMSLGHTFALMLNRKAVESAGDDYGMNPVGTGPFRLEQWEKGSKVTLTRFDDFWGDKPAYRTLIFRAVTEPSSRTIELETAAVDISYYIAPNDIKRIEENPQLQLFRTGDTSVTYMGLNCAKPPFDDVRARKAIAHALDVTVVHNAAWRGVGSVPAGAMPPSIRYYDKEQKVRQQDKELAKKLMEEVGIKAGTKFQIWTNERKERVDMATIIQNQLEEYGITSEIKILEWGAYLDGLKKKEHDLFILGWNSSVPDPDYALGGVFLSNMIGTQNFAYFDNKEVDEMLYQGRQMVDGPEREALYVKVQRKLNDEYPWIYLHNDEWIIGAQKDVKDFGLNPLGYHSLRRVRFD